MEHGPKFKSELNVLWKRKGAQTENCDPPWWWPILNVAPTHDILCRALNGYDVQRTGTQKRNYIVTKPAKNGGKACVYNINKDGFRACKSSAGKWSGMVDRRTGDFPKGKHPGTNFPAGCGYCCGGYKNQTCPKILKRTFTVTAKGTDNGAECPGGPTGGSWTKDCGKKTGCDYRLR